MTNIGVRPQFSWGLVLLGWVLLLVAANALATSKGEITGYWVYHDGSAVLAIEPEADGTGYRISIASVLRDHHLQGLVVASDLKRHGGQLRGKILEPLSGHTYRVRLHATTEDRLEVRAYIGVAMLGQTLHWQRLESYREEFGKMLMALPAGLGAPDKTRSTPN
jgi:uncharacterized protein (DUF2147 family)